MQYVDVAGIGSGISRFGLGCMRFPKDESEAIEMVRYAIDHGVNYLDTAYVYKDSEAILCKALQGGYRERIKLASKAPMWNIEEHDDFETYLDIQLKRLNTDYLDVYLLHNLYGHNLEKVKRYEGFAFLEDMQKKGKIGAKGFSMHNTLDAFKETIDAHEWDMAQIQLNILDVETQAGLEGLIYGAAKGVAMVVMEPLRGGGLVSSMPPAVTRLLEAYPEKRSIVEWAFRWLYDKPEASIILSGTSSLEQLKDNLRIFDDARAGCMNAADQDLIVQLRKAYEAQHVIDCTECDYCMPCSQGVAIPDILKLYNNLKLLNDPFGEKLVYTDSLYNRSHGADKCIECGECEDVCPQDLKIIEALKTAHEALIMPQRVLTSFASDRDRSG